MNIQDILQEYIEQIIPQMVQQGFHFTLVKGGEGYEHLAEQSHFAHIINGIFGVSRLLTYLEEEGIFALDERQYRRVLSLYTAHDLHKTEAKIGGSEFAISLEDVERAVKSLTLNQFAETTPEEHRAANVHLRSSHKGDFIDAFADDPRIWTLIRIADSMASMTSAGASSALRSLQRYIQDLCPEFALNYALHFHKLSDVRGVLTNLLHNLIGNTLKRDVDLFPLLFFTDGIVYIGPKKIESFDRNEFITNLSKNLLSEGLSSVRSLEQAKEGMRKKEYSFQKYVYLFADIEIVLEAIFEYALEVKPDAKIGEKIVKEFFGKKQAVFSDVKEFIEKLNISLEEVKEFNQLWFTVTRYLLMVDGVVRDLLGEKDRLSWFFQTFKVRADIQQPLIDASPIFLRGKGGKYVAIIGYHFLKGGDFAEHPVIQYPPNEVLTILQKKLLAAFEQHDLSQAKQMVSQDLGIEEDVENYLQENLIFSWEQRLQLTNDAFATYTKPKKKKTSNICTLCSRDSKDNMPMREGIFGDFVQGFSNRNLPRKIQSDNMSWCPVCYLEFMLRSIAGLTLPSGTDKSKSKRLFLYVLPTFSFTPEHLNWLSRKVLKPFKQLTRLQIRDYGKDLPGHARIWLENKALEEDMLDKLMRIFEREAERMEQQKQDSGREPVGDRLLTTSLQQSNYLLFIWEKAAYGSTQDDSQIPTRSEMWAKALFASVIIGALTSCKVVVTEKPYFPLSDPTELKSSILLDAPHNILRGILPDRSGAISLADFRKMLDICAAVWQINSDVTRRTKDKHVAERLERITTEPLAGAFFYKEFARLNEEKKPHDVYTLACQILLEQLGGDKMILSQQLAEKSMELFLPYRRSMKQQRGKARSYELMFRETADGFKQIYKSVVPAHAGTTVEAEQMSEVKNLLSGKLLKGLERRQESKRGDGKVNPWRGDLKTLVMEFVTLVVDRLFLEYAHGSFTEFNQAVNSMADGIFFVTDMNINDKWEQYNKLVETWKKAHPASNNEAQDNEGGSDV